MIGVLLALFFAGMALHLVSVLFIILRYSELGPEGRGRAAPINIQSRDWIERTKVLTYILTGRPKDRRLMVWLVVGRLSLLSAPVSLLLMIVATVVPHIRVAS